MEAYECSICFGEFNDPRVISCGHTFCKKCLQQLKKPNHLRCPLCRCTFPSVDSLPSNFIILKWISDTKSKNIPKKEIQCQHCENKPAKVWCDHCEVHYCEGCDGTMHSKTLKHHKRVGLKEKLKRPIWKKCATHGRDSEIYCGDCKELKCTLCVIEEHKQHNTLSVSKCAEERRKELKSCLGVLEDLGFVGRKEKELKGELEKDKEELGGLEKRVLELKSRINQHQVNIKQLANRSENIKTSKVVLLNEIQQISDVDLVENMVTIKNKFMDVIKEVYPEGLDSYKSCSHCGVSNVSSTEGTSNFVTCTSCGYCDNCTSTSVCQSCNQKSKTCFCCSGNYSCTSCGYCNNCSNPSVCQSCNQKSKTCFNCSGNYSCLSCGYCINCGSTSVCQHCSKEVNHCYNCSGNYYCGSCGYCQSCGSTSVCPNCKKANHCYDCTGNYYCDSCGYCQSCGSTSVCQNCNKKANHCFNCSGHYNCDSCGY